MLKKSLILSSVLAMGACAYAIDDSIQDVQFETPGAYGATCHAYVEGVDHVIKPPQRISLAKSRKDMTVDCLAPGNRRKKIFIEPGYQKSAGWNALNGGAGLAWDYASNALYRWPDRIEVNFTDMPVTPQPLPAQDRHDVRDPATVPLEEFLPGRPRLNSEIGAYESGNQLQRRQKIEYGDALLPEDSTSGFAEPANPGRDKGDLQSVIDSIGIEQTTTKTTTKVIAPETADDNIVPVPPESAGVTNVPSKTSGAGGTPGTSTTTTTTTTTSTSGGLAPRIAKPEATTSATTTTTETTEATPTPEATGTGTTITKTGTKKTITVKSKAPTPLVPGQ